MNKYFIFFCIYIIFLGTAGVSCNKYLDAKANSNFAVPSSVPDLQALMDRYSNMNNTEAGSGEVSADNYYLSYADWQAMADNYRAMYKWDSAYVFASSGNDWSNQYLVIYRSNIVLNYAAKINRTANDQTDYNNTIGQAYYFRAKGFLQMASLFSMAYDAVTAKEDLGIPLRTGIDFNVVSVRSNNEETFQQIISDLKNAATLLPLAQVHVMRPAKAAAYGLLARTLLYMRRYTEAGLYADSCLQLYNKLIDYNSLNAASAYPVPQFNTEIICEGMIPVPSPLYNIAKIDSALYASYATGDLRKNIFFSKNTNGSYSFKGSYEGGANLNSSICTDEMYLIRAECFARANAINPAMNDLNTLMIKRWKAGTFVPFTASNTTDALTIILNERRKELLMRGLRWMDIKRLNKEGAGIVLTRLLNGVSYSLPPNDLRYALAIPEAIIAQTGMLQNPR